MGKTKIEWCDEVFNPITGCRSDCNYCYSDQLAKRFSGDFRSNLRQKDKYREEEGLYILDEMFMGENGKYVAFPFRFAPTFHRYRLGLLDEWIAGRNVYVGAVADMFGDWVPEKWITDVFDACKASPHHNYMFLTKNPLRYLELKERGLLPEGNSFWYGTTITNEKDPYFVCKAHKTFLCIEPIHGEFSKEKLQRDIFGKYHRPDWIIIGPETGRRKGKIVPEFEWIKEIVLAADTAGVPVYMRNSLAQIVGEKNMRQDFPKELLEKRVGDNRSAIWHDACQMCKKKMDKQKMVSLSGKVKRRGKWKTIMHMCRECYVKWCKEIGIESYVEELYEEKKL